MLNYGMNGAMLCSEMAPLKGNLVGLTTRGTNLKQFAKFFLRLK